MAEVEQGFKPKPLLVMPGIDAGVKGCSNAVHVPVFPQVGFINSLKFSSTGDFLVAGVGQEHRSVVPCGSRWAVGENGV